MTMPTPPILPPTPPAPPSETPVVIEETPQIVSKPKRKIGKAVKAFGGLIMLVLLIGGIIVGRSIIQERNLVESDAASKCGQHENKTSCEAQSAFCTDDKEYTCYWNTTLDECKKQATGNDCGGGEAGTCGDQVTNYQCRNKSFGWVSQCGDHGVPDSKDFKFTCSQTTGDNCTWGDFDYDSCVGDEGEGGTCTNDTAFRCDMWYCPEGDTSNDKECNSKDSSAYIKYSGKDCANKTLGSNCGQIDYFNSSGESCLIVKNLTNCSTDSFFDKCTVNNTCEKKLCQMATGCDDQCDTDADCQEAEPVIPDCTNLATNADLNNLQVGTEYSFQLTAGGTAPITDVEMSVYDGISCSSYLLKPYVQQAVSGPGIYTIKWTPTQTGSFIAYGRVWNNGFAECKADCVDGPPRYLCANAPLCKLTGTVKTAPVMSCVSLTGDTSIEVGDIATFTCEANFSSVSPVAYFRYKYITGGGIYTTSEPIALNGTTASYDIIIDQAGNWIVQCQVCTDDTASKSCTVWGQAN